MGYMRHDAIVVTSWSNEALTQAWNKAVELGLPICGISSVLNNSYRSFLIAPDGSKEGWATSIRMDKARKDFKKWIAFEQTRMMLPVEYVHVSFGGDEPELAHIVKEED